MFKLEFNKSPISDFDKYFDISFLFFGPVISIEAVILFLFIYSLSFKTSSSGPPTKVSE